MGGTGDDFRAWREALAAYAEALRGYADLLDEGGRDYDPARVEDREALKAADAALGAVGRPPDYGQEGGEAARRIFGLCAALEEARGALNRGAAAALAPSAAGGIGHMSRTFLEGVERSARRLRAARAAAADAAQLAGTALAAGEWGRALARDPPEMVSAAYQAAAPTGPGAALYAAVLGHWKAEGLPALRRMADDAEAAALGIPPATPTATLDAVAARAQMHPLQAMGLTFGLHPGGVLPPGAGTGGALLIDATLPQATTAVRYDLAPLVDARAAAAFGPLASSYSGLSLALVRRLQTIRVEPIPVPPPDRPRAAIFAPTGSPPPGCGVGRFVRTIDAGGSYQEMTRRGEGARACAALGAGPRPRVERLGELLATALDDAKGGRLGDPPAFLEGYAGMPPSPLYTRAEVEAALLARLPAEYDAAPLSGTEDFRLMLTGGRGDLSSSYIARATAAVARASVEKETLRRETAGDAATAALFGSRAAAARGGEREALLTALVQLGGSVAATRRAISAAYDEGGFEPRVEAALRGGGEGGGEREEAVRRQEVLALARQIVKRALLPPKLSERKKRVEKLATVEPAPTLKGYALARGDPTHPGA